MKISLTFDNGPTPGITDSVLDVLDKRGIKATFFVLGKNLQDQAGRDLVIRAQDAGHLVGNHTFTHTVQFGLSDSVDEIMGEIKKTEAILDDLKVPRALFRPVGGGGVLGRNLLSPQSRDYLIKNKYSCVIWNNLPRDWVDPDGWPTTALVTCKNLDWSVLVIHDFDTGGGMRHLDAFLDNALALGAEFVLDFPQDCLLIDKGVPRPDIADFLPEAS